MAQSEKKNLALFQSLRKEMAAKAKAAGKTDVPNLQESVVEVHIHGGTKRKVELPPRSGKGKDVKRVRAVLLGTGSASGAGSRILFEPMSVIFGTLCNIGTFLHLCLNAIKVLYVIVYVEF